MKKLAIVALLAATTVWAQQKFKANRPAKALDAEVPGVSVTFLADGGCIADVDVRVGGHSPLNRVALKSLGLPKQLCDGLKAASLAHAQSSLANGSGL